jgi:hypothetical protein
MPNLTQIVVTGPEEPTLADCVTKGLSSVRPTAMGCASAFVSLAGVNELVRIAKIAGVQKCRLIAGVSHFVTHPEALHAAIEAGWNLRLGTGTKGIFHPKLIVSGNGFSRAGDLKAASFAYVGSGNLTHAGLRRNVECGLLSLESHCATIGSEAFGKLWQRAAQPNARILNEYAEKFAERNRQRSVEEIESLGIYDSEDELARSYTGLLETKPPRFKTIPNKVAHAAWAGVESFTGDYMFQLEFPRDAGEVLAKIVARRGAKLGTIPIFCKGDGRVQNMVLAYYHQNSMYRLNIPNDVAGVSEARANRKGIVLVTATTRKDAIVELDILPPGAPTEAVLARSVALGTWGRTRTRAYGWF